MTHTHSWSLRAICWLACVGWLNVAHGSAQAEPDAPLRAVYETRLEAAGGRIQIRRWAFSRRELDLDYHDFERAITERWSRDAKANMSFVRVYQRERTAVRYMTGDLAALDIHPDWTKLRHVIEPPQARSFKFCGTKQVLGRAAQQFRGTRGATRIEILWLSELGIPAEVRLSERGRPRLTVRLIELSTERPAALDLRLRQLDATDFGDLEQDPFVRRHHEDPPPSPTPQLAVLAR